MNNFCSLTFASQLGVAVYSPSIELLFSGRMMLWRPDEFGKHLSSMKEHHQIDLAIVQAFGDIPDYPSQHLEQIKAAFPQYILVHRDQWNPTRIGYRNRRALAEAYHGCKIAYPEQVNAILMGRWLCNILHDSGIPFPAAHLEELSRTTRRFPHWRELRNLQVHRMREVAP